MSDLDDNAILGRTFLFWVILVTVAVIGVTWVGYALKPTWLGYERKAFTESHQYVEARKAEIVADIQEYNRLGVDIAKLQEAPGDHSRVIVELQAQQKSLANKIRAALAKIPQDTWPPGSERF